MVVRESTASDWLAGLPVVEIAKAPDEPAQVDRPLRPAPSFETSQRTLNAPKEPLNPSMHDREATLFIACHVEPRQIELLQERPTGCCVERRK